MAPVESVAVATFVWQYDQVCIRRVGKWGLSTDWSLLTAKWSISQWNRAYRTKNATFQQMPVYTGHLVNFADPDPIRIRRKNRACFHNPRGNRIVLGCLISKY